MEYKLDDNEIKRLYLEEKWTILDISNYFKVNHGTIRLRLKRSNTPLRSHSQNQKLVMNRKEVKEKTTKTSIKSNNKRIKTNIQKYGTEVPSNNKEIKKKWLKEHKEKHGVLWPNQRQEVRDKYVNTCNNKYSVSNVSKVSEVQEKISDNRWKNKTEEELQEISNKRKETLINNFGVDNPLKNNNIKKKVKENRWLNKTKEELEEIKEKAQKTRIKNRLPEIERNLKLLNLELVDNFNNVTDFMNIKCTKCNTKFKTVLDYIFNGYGLCPKCFPRSISSYESEIQNFILTLPNIDIDTNNRTFLSNNKEIDILIRNKKIAIEFDGLYYHSDKFMIDKNYHLDKMIECEKLGYMLIHIFEDEWIYKKEIVKSRIKQIMSISDSIKIYARNCYIKEISNKEKNNFLDKYHIQGIDISKISLGAFYNNQLVSVMTFSRGNIAKGSKSEEGVWELNRFCSDYQYHVIGIASKLLTYFKRNYQWKKIFSYADRRWSDGNLYKKLGFKLEKVTDPNYWYVKGLKRLHRFSLRKKLNEPKDIPEWILRQKDGYFRVWDCGNIKFILNNT